MEVYDKSIPIWEKAVLTAEEAAELSGVNISILRIHGHLAVLGQSEFPSFFVGNHMKVHRELFIKWLADIAKNHEKLELKTVKRVLEEATAPSTRGRPRKNRLCG